MSAQVQRKLEFQVRKSTRSQTKKSSDSSTSTPSKSSQKSAGQRNTPRSTRRSARNKTVYEDENVTPVVGKDLQISPRKRASDGKEYDVNMVFICQAYSFIFFLGWHQDE